MLVRNVGTTAICFNIGREKCPSVLVKPGCGYIIPGAHQIFFLSTCPTETTIQQHTLLLHLNFWSSFTQVSKEMQFFSFYFLPYFIMLSCPLHLLGTLSLVVLFYFNLILVRPLKLKKLLLFHTKVGAIRELNKDQ